MTKPPTTRTSSTIVALSTSPHPAALAVIRISGPKTKDALRAIFKSRKNPADHPRLVTFGYILDYETKEQIDQAICFFMPGPHSFTGEDVGELQFHGSPLLVQRTLRSLYAFGLIAAEPGEFTKRAFLNGKLDLAQAEAIADLIHASSDEALRVAGEQLSGRLSSALTELGEPLRDILAELEAGVDFPEEEISPDSLANLRRSVDNAISNIDALLGTYGYGSVLRDGFRVLLCGAPNVGKSSTLNLLLGRERSIVTPISGTTRDVIEEEAILKGYKFVFCDSAGIRETEDPVEQIGVGLARDRVEWADLVLLVADATDPHDRWRQIKDEIQYRAKKIWMVVNKIDLNSQALGTIYCDSNICEQNIYLSAKTKHGTEVLFEALVNEVKQRISATPERSVVMVNERHRLCLVRAKEALHRFVEGVEQMLPAEVLAVDLRGGLSELDEIVGKTFNEDILGRIFSKFCIGK